MRYRKLPDINNYNCILDTLDMHLDQEEIPRKLVSLELNKPKTKPGSFLIRHIPGFTYNFGESRKNPDKVRQKYLDAMFGPTAITAR